MAGPPHPPGSSQHAPYTHERSDGQNDARSAQQQRELSPFTLAQMISSDPNHSLLARMTQAPPSDPLFWPPPSSMPSGLPQSSADALQMQHAPLAPTAPVDAAAINELFMSSGLYLNPDQRPQGSASYSAQQMPQYQQLYQLDAHAPANEVMQPTIAHMSAGQASTSGPDTFVAMSPSLRPEGSLPSSASPGSLEVPLQDDSKPTRRAILACRFCRSRKLRCDGAEPCRQCERRGETCEYTLPPAAKRRAQQRSVDAASSSSTSTSATMTGSGLVSNADETAAGTSSKRHDSGATKQKQRSK